MTFHRHGDSDDCAICQTSRFTVYAEDGEYSEDATTIDQALAQFRMRHPNLCVAAIVDDDMQPALVIADQIDDETLARERARKPADKRSARFLDAPVVGETVSGISEGIVNGRAYKGAWTGVYQGIRPSEWTGEPVHFFTDGIINVTPQGCFAIPVAQFESE